MSTGDPTRRGSARQPYFGGTPLDARILEAGLVQELALSEYGFVAVPVEGLGGEGEIFRRPGGGFVTRDRAFELIRAWVSDGGGLPFPQEWIGPVDG